MSIISVIQKPILQDTIVLLTIIATHIRKWWAKIKLWKPTRAPRGPGGPDVPGAPGSPYKKYNHKKLHKIQSENGHTHIVPRHKKTWFISAFEHFVWQHMILHILKNNTNTFSLSNKSNIMKDTSYRILINQINYSVSEKRQQICFCQNSVKFPLILITLGR